MSEREGPNGSESQDSNKDESKSSSQPMPAGPSTHSYYANEPIQFRVRGSTITGASPPSFVTLDDIMKAAHGMQNMALAHEIAVDNDFKLEPFEPPDNSYQKLVKETMHRAYFDILKEELNSDPPSYKQALVLLEDVKLGLFSILLPRHTRIRDMIEEVLDTEFIKQQAENNSLDFNKYAKFVIDLMAKLAAPARDEMIQNITTLTDTVDVFRSILEALEVLKLDLANTLIAMVRPHVQKESVLYEKMKFEELLKVTEDGLQHTRAWLKRHIDKTDLSLPVTDANIIRNVTAQTLAKAYLELLEWDQDASTYPEIKRHIDKTDLSLPVTDANIIRNVTAQTLAKAYLELLEWDQDASTYPETVNLDAARFAELGVQVYRLICVASLMLVSPACGDPNVAKTHKLNLKDKIVIIMDNAASDTQLKAVLPSIAEEVILVTEQLLDSLNQDPLTADTKELIRTQIISLRDPEHKVRQIVRTRVLEFLKMILVCAGGSRQIPVGLSALAPELTNISGTLLRYVMHNKAVFTSYYIDIVTEELSKT